MSVRNVEGALEVVADSRQWRARAVLSTTGTWRHPFVPDYAGASGFKGVQIHSADYVSADPLWASGSPSLAAEIPGRRYLPKYQGSPKPSGSRLRNRCFCPMKSMDTCCFSALPHGCLAGRVAQQLAALVILSWFPGPGRTGSRRAGFGAAILKL